MARKLNTTTFRVALLQFINFWQTPECSIYTIIGKASLYLFLESLSGYLDATPTVTSPATAGDATPTVTSPATVENATRHLRQGPPETTHRRWRLQQYRLSSSQSVLSYLTSRYNYNYSVKKIKCHILEQFTGPSPRQWTKPVTGCLYTGTEYSRELSTGPRQGHPGLFNNVTCKIRAFLGCPDSNSGIIRQQGVHVWVLKNAGIGPWDTDKGTPGFPAKSLLFSSGLQGNSFQQSHFSSLLFGAARELFPAKSLLFSLGLQGHSGLSSKVAPLRSWSNTTSPVGSPQPPRSHPGHGHQIVAVRGNRQTEYLSLYNPFISNEHSNQPVARYFPNKGLLPRVLPPEAAVACDNARYRHSNIGCFPGRISPCSNKQLPWGGSVPALHLSAFSYISERRVRQTYGHLKWLILC